MASAGFVYLIGPLEGCHKIGFSTDPARRAKALSRSRRGSTVAVVHAIATDDMVWLERMLHNAYDHLREWGEWFRLSDDDLHSLTSVGTLHFGANLPAFCRQPRPLPVGAPTTPEEHTAVAATNIVAILKSRRMTQKWLAELAGMQPPDISRLLRAGREGESWATSLATLARIAEALEVPLAQLLTSPPSDAEVVRPYTTPRTGERAGEIPKPAKKPRRK